jgi:hypothetical protein
MVLYNDVLNARAPDEFSYATELLPPLTLGLSITLAKVSGNLNRANAIYRTGAEAPTASRCTEAAIASNVR